MSYEVIKKDYSIKSSSILKNVANFLFFPYFSIIIKRKVGIDMATLIIMSGPPGCGKSTYIAQHRKPTDAVISRDVVRADVASRFSPTDDYFLHEKRVFKEFVHQINDAGLCYDIVWADATHLNYRSVEKLLRSVNVKEFALVKVICLEVSLDTCLARNAKRTGRAHVPENSLKRMYESYHRVSPRDFPSINMEVEAVNNG